MTTIAPPHGNTAPLEPRVKQTSRKGKKAWRRNVDITEEERGMDVLREDVRLGVSADAAPEDLFVLDTTGDDQVRQREFGKKRLRVDEILQPQSGVPALSTKPIKPAPAKPTRKLSPNETAKLNKALEQVKKRARTAGDKTAPADPAAEAAKRFSIWGEEEAAAVPAPVPASQQQPQYKAPITMRKVPLVKQITPGVQVDDAGLSYRPDPQAHQSLLQAAINEEVKRIMTLEEFQARAPTRRAQKSNETGMTVDEHNDESGSDDEDAQDNHATGFESYSAQPAPKRRTQTERNKRRRIFLEQQALARKRKAKAFLKKLDKLPQFQAILDQQQETQQERLARKAKARAEQERTPRPPPQPVEVQLTEDLAPSLRALKPEGSVLKDRFRSLLARKVITASRVSKPQRAYALKVYEKRDYREFV
ncbi:hypothetical protein RI367_000308 [Sorochytrium milnesiophthora]